MTDPEAAFRALAVAVMGVVALAGALVLWWAIRFARLKA